MIELKDKIIQAWRARYEANRWPFIPRMLLAKIIGENIDNAIRELRKEGKIILRKGVNDVLVMLNDKQVLKDNMDLLN